MADDRSTATHRGIIMAMNPIQFQPGLSMVEFVAHYGTEAMCRRALYRARWPRGFRCPACGDRSPRRALGQRRAWQRQTRVARLRPPRLDLLRLDLRPAGPRLASTPPAICRCASARPRPRRPRSPSAATPSIA